MIQTPATTGTGINCGTSSLFFDKSGSFSIACRVYRIGNGVTISTGTGGHLTIEPIFTGGMAESETIGLNMTFFMGWISGSNRIGLDYEDISNGGNWPISSSATFSNSTPYHFAATYNTGSATWRFYVNGALDRSVTTAATSSQRIPDTGSRQFTCISCGAVSAGTRTGAFNGYVSDVCIWSTVLNDAEIDLLANSRSKLAILQLQSASLKGYWRLDDGKDAASVATADKAIMDLSGNNRHGKAFGTITSRGDIYSSY